MSKADNIIDEMVSKGAEEMSEQQIQQLADSIRIVKHIDGSVIIAFKNLLSTDDEVKNDSDQKT